VEKVLVPAGKSSLLLQPGVGGHNVGDAANLQPPPDPQFTFRSPGD